MYVSAQLQFDIWIDELNSKAETELLSNINKYKLNSKAETEL